MSSCPGEKLFSGVLLDVFKRDHETLGAIAQLLVGNKYSRSGDAVWARISVRVFRKRDSKDNPEAMQLQQHTFQEGTEVKGDGNGLEKVCSGEMVPSSSLAAPLSAQQNTCCRHT
ncbi:PWWP domain-containing protein 2A [Plecturocebus cupreus]